MFHGECRPLTADGFREIAFRRQRSAAEAEGCSIWVPTAEGFSTTDVNPLETVLKAMSCGVNLGISPSRPVLY